MVRRALLPALALLLVAALAGAQDEAVELKWQFKKGETFFQTLTTETNQEMKVMGMEVKQKPSQTFYISWTPVEEKDKSWTIKQKIEGLKMDIQIGGNTISYDSTNPGAGANPLGDFFKALVGSEFTLTVSPEMKVTKVDGRAEFVKKLVDANPQMKTLLEGILSEDALKQMADPSFAVLPGKPVKKGDKWKSEAKLSLGPLGSYDTTYEYTYEGKDEKNKDLEKISVVPTIKYNPPTGGDAGGLPFKIKSAALESKGAKGTIVFDSKAGRIDNSELNLNLEGKLDIEIGGMGTAVELKQTQKTTVKTSSSNPISK